MRLLRVPAWLLAAAVVVVFVAFWPTNLGGNTTYVTTHGTSMTPRFHAGDLAIVKPTSSYHVGDIVAYHSATLHDAIVLHRVVAIHNGRLTFKGDNNGFLDPDHPTTAQLVGKLHARVPHGGAIRAVLQQPVILFPLLALTFGGLFWIPFGGRKRRKRTPARRLRAAPPVRPTAGPRRLPVLCRAVLIAAAVGTTGSLLAAATLWQTPSTEAATTTQRYQQTATLGYSGSAPPGAAYPDGRIRTGDPVFTRMVGAFTADLAYKFEIAKLEIGAGTPHVIRGTSQVVASVSSATGWHHDLVLAPARAFAGDRMRATAKIDIDALRRVQREFTAETGLDASSASLRITWNLHISGEANGTKIGADLAPVVDFQLSPVELLPKLSTSGGVRVAAGASVAKSGSIAVATQRVRQLGFWRVHVSWELARLLSLLVVAAILAACAAVIAADRRRVSRGVAVSIIARYGYLLVHADAIPVVAERAVVHVNSMRDLARLAKMHDELIVHADEYGCHRFALFTDTVAYFFEVEPAGRNPVPLALAST